MVAEWLVLILWLFVLPVAIGLLGGEWPGCTAIAVTYAFLFATNSILFTGNDVDRGFVLRISGDVWIILAVAGAAFVLRTGAWRDR